MSDSVRKRFEALAQLGGAVTAGGRIELNGAFYRLRRGRYVQIPPEWVGKTVPGQKIRNRKSKAPRKLATTIGQYGHSALGCRCSSHDRTPRERLPEDGRRFQAYPGHPRTWAPRKTRSRRRYHRDDESDGA